MWTEFDFIREACALVKDKVITLTQVPTEIDFMFKPAKSLDYAGDLLIGKNEGAEATARIVQSVMVERLAKLPQEQFHHDGILDDLTQLSAELGLKNRGLVLWPTRVGVCGRKNSPDGLAVIVALGREELVKRLQWAHQKLTTLVAS